jgi:HD-like signal output (HDOD) protein
MDKLPQLDGKEELRMQIMLRMHSQIGALLLESWNLPAELVCVAAEHEELTRDPGPVADYTDLVIAANIEYYGDSVGRYAGIDRNRVPALRKAWPTDDAAVVPESPHA